MRLWALCGALAAGEYAASFAPMLTVNKVKKALSSSTNLWFDRSDSHEGGAGSATFAE